MSSSALMYSCPPYGCPAQKRPDQSLLYYFRFVNIIPDRAIFALCSNQFFPSRVISCDGKKSIIAVFDTCTLDFIKINRIVIFSNAFGFHTFFRRYSRSFIQLQSLYTSVLVSGSNRYLLYL